MHTSDDSVNTQKNWAMGLRRYWKVLVALLIWLLCYSWYLLPISPEMIERYYSKGLYRTIMRFVTAVTGAIPFSVMLTLLCILFVLYSVTWASVWIYRRRKLNQPHWKGALWGFSTLLFSFPILWLWFLVFWGIGYQRLPIETRLGFDSSAITEEEVRCFETNLLEIIRRDQPANEDDRNTSLAIASIANAMQQIVLEWDGIPIRIPKRVKSTPPGLFLMNGTSGMCVPLTLEPHVDGGLPDAAYVSVAAHELGHIAGLCDEGETNLLGYVAGLRADNPYARYAVALRLYRSIAGERKAALERLPEQAREDLRRAREASQHYRINWLQQWSWRTYNHYLKSQGVKEGVKSYSRGTQLIVYAWRSGHVSFAELSTETKNQ